MTSTIGNPIRPSDPARLLLARARARTLSADRGGVLSRRDAEAVGLSPSQVVTLLRRGAWTRVHRGFFVPGAAPDPDLLAARRVLAALRHRHGDRADLTVGARWVADARPPRRSTDSR